MRQILWFFTYVGMAMWSFMLWLAHSTASLFAGLVKPQPVDGFMTDHGPLQWLFDRVGEMATSATILVWLVGMLLLYGTTKIITRLFCAEPDLRRLR